jgi:hypothetical protein
MIMIYSLINKLDTFYCALTKRNHIKNERRRFGINRWPCEGTNNKLCKYCKERKI